MSTILDGKIVRTARKQLLIERVREKSHAGITPCLAIIQVGNRLDSTTFIKAKKKFAAEIGVKEIHIQIPEDAHQDEIVAKIREFNNDKSIHGIIVQLPLPSQTDRDFVISAIDPKKDVDGLTPTNVNAWLEGRSDAVWPATARGIKELFDYYNIALYGKKVVVIGRSMLVGKPIAAMCLSENATVTIAHSKTPDLAEMTRLADIIIVAIGKPHFIGKEHVRAGQVIIDVGINNADGNTAETKSAENQEKRKLVGDVDFHAVEQIVDAITPVPGGVGQMTVLALFENLVDSAV